METAPSGRRAASGPLISATIRSRALCTSPRSTARATGPSKKRSQKRRRARASPMVALTAPRKLSAKPASRPRPSGKRPSIRARTWRARTGAVPALEMPMTTGPRSTMAGMMKLDRSGRSTTLTGTPAARAAAETRRSTASTPVAP